MGILRNQPSLWRRLITGVFTKLIALLLICVPSAPTQQKPARVKEDMRAPVEADVRFTLSGDASWSDTGVDVIPGDTLLIHTKSELGSAFANSSQCDPEGQDRNWKDLFLALPVNSVGRGAVVGRIGGAESVPFMVGGRRYLAATQRGRLFLGLNEPWSGHSVCRFHINIKRVNGGEAHKRMPTIPVTARVLDQFPRRVTDATGTRGDMVNFLMVGSQESVEAAFQGAGWTAVDRNPEDAALHVLIASIAKRTYTEMPMSDLYLFGRAQDYGFARAKPIEVIMYRHHLRLWKAPFELNSRAVWVGAATHDIGLEGDERDGSITHKIDPDVDKERDFVGETFRASGAATVMTRVLPKNPVFHARTATGGSFSSDGQLLIIVLAH